MLGVYIAYPFCRQKCSFCNFASGVSGQEVVARYEAKLLAEIESHAWSEDADTVYFGGGTPSLMEAGYLKRLLDGIPGKRIRETTIECAPGTVDAGAKGWRECGVNRVSLGVQSFNEEELRETGRRHSAASVQRDCEVLRAAGIANINIDLIAGLPGQTVDSWQRSLEWIGRIGPEHVSVYVLEVDEESRLGNELLKGGWRYGAGRVPGDDSMAEFYERAVEWLEGEGWGRYEISNFARPGLASQHNLKYWRREAYVGFGVDAHSFDGRRRWSTPETIEGYLAGETGEQETVDAGQEHFFVGLRLSEGIRPSEEERRRFAKPIERWKEAGMLEEREGRLRIKREAVLLSNEILEEFVDG